MNKFIVVFMVFVLTGCQSIVIPEKPIPRNDIGTFDYMQHVDIPVYCHACRKLKPISEGGWITHYWYCKKCLNKIHKTWKNQVPTKLKVELKGDGYGNRS